MIAVIFEVEPAEGRFDEYLDHVVFHEPRPFSRDDFKDFMLEQSQPYPEMLQLFAGLKRRDAMVERVTANVLDRYLGKGRQERP